MSWLEDDPFTAAVTQQVNSPMPAAVAAVVSSADQAPRPAPPLHVPASPRPMEPVSINEAPPDANDATFVVCGLDGSSRTLGLRLTLTGLQAALAAGAQLGSTRREDFGLAFPEKRGWLDEESTLGEQGLCDGDTLVYKKKYFIADEELSRRDEVDIRLLYPQCVDALVSGFFRGEVGHLVGLAALEARVYQAAHGERMPSVQQLSEFLPVEHRDGATVKCVIDQVGAMSLMSEMEYEEGKSFASVFDSL